MNSAGSHALAGYLVGAALGGLGGLGYMLTIIPLEVFTSSPLWLILAAPILALYIALPATIAGAVGALLGARVKRPPPRPPEDPLP